MTADNKQKEGRSAKIGKGWAWSVDWQGNGKRELCNWVEPMREGLEEKSKPSPEAQMVHVAIIPMKEYLRNKVEEKHDR